MAFVIDASVTAAWILPDETHPLAEAVHKRLEREQAFHPSIWWLEIRNLLLMAERTKRISAHNSEAILAGLANYPVTIDRDPVSQNLMAIARRHTLTVYDASYLELAARLGVSLVTLDRRLADAAIAEGVEILTA